MSVPKADLRTAVEQAIELEASARHQLQDAEGRWQLESAALQQLSAPDKKLPSLLAGLGPSRGFCNVPMDHARKSGCPIASTIPLDLTARRSEGTAAAEVEQKQRLVDVLRVVTDEKRRLLADAAKATALARRVELEAASRFDKLREPLLERRARLVQAERFVREAEELDERVISRTVRRCTRGGDRGFVHGETGPDPACVGRGARVSLSSTYDLRGQAKFSVTR
ncbi:MAG: hypothetical protein IPF99_18925 [Deltaproteobacteria bacterium]|nr:hypothetical protein [Deltaproteobacteria bacterium]